MKILGLDFETTCTDPIDPREARIIEIGAVLWDTTRGCPLVLVNRTVWHASYQYDSRIEGLTGMTLEDLQTFGSDPKFALQKLLKLYAKAEAIVAHNGNEFDKIVLACELQRHGLAMPTTPWIDTTSDIQYPEKISTRKLEFLAPAHGFLNPFSHRALFDVISMLKILNYYNFENVLERSKMPDVTLLADTVKPFGPTRVKGEQQKQAAKDRGYRWNPDAKQWTKRVKENEVEAEQLAASFPVVVLS